MESIKITLLFEEIDCANCAAKIENLLNKEELIDEARINFLSKKIIITYHDIEDIIAFVQKIVNKIEPDAFVYSNEMCNNRSDIHEHHHDHEGECCHHEHHHEHDECCNHEHLHEHEGECCHHEHHQEHEGECCHHEHHHDHEECCHHEHHHDHEGECCHHEHHHDHEECCQHEHHHEHEECCHHEHHHEHEGECCHHEHHHEHEGECCCHNHETSDHTALSIDTKGLKKEELLFKDIDCANCASKIEVLLNKEELIDEARINFVSKKIIIAHHSNEDIVPLIQSITNKIEPDAFIYRIEQEEKSNELNNTKKDDTKVEKKNNQKKSLPFSIGIFLCLIAFILEKLEMLPLNEIISRIIYIIAYVLIAKEIIIKSIKNISHGNIFDENFLMVVASVGALIINEGLEACLVVALYRIGEYFQNKALGESTQAIASLTALKVDKTTLKNGTLVDTDKVKINDEIIVKVGERIPLDGIIVSGTSTLDTSCLTGESLPKDATSGDEVLSGCINLSSVLTIRVTKESNQSTASKIIEMVEEASNKKSKTEEFITKFARIYTPVVLSIALIVFILEGFIFKELFTIKEALNNTFVFLVTSCPCALVISIPLAFFGGIGKCSSYGVLVKGGNYIEALTRVKLICTDKTGTITKGNFKIKNINPYKDFTSEDLLKYLINIEKYSNHPVAKAITSFKEDVEKLNVTNIKEIPGLGITCQVDGKDSLAGNEKLLQKYNIKYERATYPGSVVYLVIGGKYVGNVLIVDEIKEESKKMVDELDTLGIDMIMLSGDNVSIVQNVAQEVGIKHYLGELLPQDKLEFLEKEIKARNENSLVAYIGDGINDTPALKLADVGIAIGGLGHDEAVAASDVVLMSDQMDSIVKAIKISKYTKKILIQNIVFALVVKLFALLIGASGLLKSYGMFLGVFADVGVCLLAILNTLRILKKRVD